MNRINRRFGAAMFLVAAAIGACKGAPTQTYEQVPDDFVVKGAPKQTHLRGLVVDFNTNAPIAGAQIVTDGRVTTSNEDGSYTIGNLRVGAVILVVTREGYEERTTQLALNGGDVAFNFRLVPLPGTTGMASAR